MKTISIIVAKASIMMNHKGNTPAIYAIAPPTSRPMKSPGGPATLAKSKTGVPINPNITMKLSVALPGIIMLPPPLPPLPPPEL